MNISKKALMSILTFLICVPLQAVTFGDLKYDNKLIALNEQEQEEISRKANKGDPEAQYCLGILYQMNTSTRLPMDVQMQRMQISLDWLRKSANQNFPAAQVRLGIFMLSNMGETQGETNEALEWFLKAAQQNDPIGQAMAGEMYKKGLGILQNFEEGDKWLKKAIVGLKELAKTGHAFAMLLLGTFYAEGSGVKQDYVQAHAWYNLATSQGYKKAEIERDEIAQLMTDSQIREAQKIAIDFQKNFK